MTLPQISIPVNIPFDIPTMLHPPLVHFAVAIPVLVLLFEVINIFLKSKSLKIITSIFLFLTIAIFFGAYLAGTTDGKATIDSGTFNAMSELKEHKLLGMYLFYASIGIFVFKLLSLVVNKTGFRIFYVLLLIGFVASVLHQGKEGGELVYKYGANVKVQSDDFDDDEDEDTKAPAKVEQPAKQKEETKKEEETKEKEQLQPSTNNEVKTDENTVEKTVVTPIKEETASDTNSSDENKSE